MQHLTTFSLVLAGLLLSGCAGTWTKPGSTEAEFAKDLFECEKDARQFVGVSGGAIGAIQFQEFGRRCLAARGYTKAK